MLCELLLLLLNLLELLKLFQLLLNLLLLDLELEMLLQQKSLLNFGIIGVH